MRQMDRWWLIVLEGAAEIILGLLTFRSPDITALVLVTLIAAWSIITGIFEIATAARLRKMIPNEWLMILSGVVSIIFGILLIAQPGAGAISIVWLLGVYALLFGILTLMLAFRLRGMREKLGRRAAGAVWLIAAAVEPANSSSYRANVTADRRCGVLASRRQTTVFRYRKYTDGIERCHRAGDRAAVLPVLSTSAALPKAPDQAARERRGSLPGNLSEGFQASRPTQGSGLRARLALPHRHQHRL
jgi:hypothetical protein